MNEDRRKAFERWRDSILVYDADTIAWNAFDSGYEEGFEALAHRAFEAGATTWQPIETAPKDGTEVVALWVPSGHKEFIFWNVARSFWDMKVTDRMIFTDPTHWMPLPEVPK